jgi:sodium/bile acid cotransporter 7
MRAFLARRWFLLLLAVGLVAACTRPGWLRPATDLLPLRPVVALSLFLMAWTLEGRRLWQAAARPAPALYALAVSAAALPALAWLAGLLFPVPDLRLGLLLIAAVPCTLSSAVLWTRLAGGNEALALLVTVLTNGLGWLVAPAWLLLATGVEAAPDAADMMGRLAVLLVLPVAVGQGVRLVPAVARVVNRHLVLNGVVTRLLVAAVLVKAAVDAIDHAGRIPLHLLLLSGLAAVLLHLAGWGLGYAGGRALGFARADCAAVAFAGSQKTLPLALYLFAAYYVEQYPLAVAPPVLYHVGQLVIDSFLADGLARRPEGDHASAQDTEAFS